MNLEDYAVLTMHKIMTNYNFSLYKQINSMLNERNLPLCKSSEIALQLSMAPHKLRKYPERTLYQEKRISEVAMTSLKFFEMGECK